MDQITDKERRRIAKLVAGGPWGQHGNRPGTRAGGAVWPPGSEVGGPEFAAAVDYVGLDVHPDTFWARLKLQR